jgi:hypothetical protein
MRSRLRLLEICVRKALLRLGLRGHHPHPPAPAPASGRGGGARARGSRLGLRAREQGVCWGGLAGLFGDTNSSSQDTNRDLGHTRPSMVFRFLR